MLVKCFTDKSRLIHLRWRYFFAPSLLSSLKEGQIRRETSLFWLVTFEQSKDLYVFISLKKVFCLAMQIIRVQSPDGMKKIISTKRETAAAFLKKVPTAGVKLCVVVWLFGLKHKLFFVHINFFLLYSKPRSAHKPGSSPHFFIFYIKSHFIAVFLEWFSFPGVFWKSFYIFSKVIKEVNCVNSTLFLTICYRNIICLIRIKKKELQSSLIVTK